MRPIRRQPGRGSDSVSRTRSLIGIVERFVEKWGGWDQVADWQLSCNAFREHSSLETQWRWKVHESFHPEEAVPASKVLP